MNCVEIKYKLYDYIDNNLDNNDKESIKLHIENCIDCKKEYEEILEAISYVQEGFDKISAPDGFMKGIKNNIKGITTQGHKVRKPLKTVFIAAALFILVTVTAFAAGGFNFLKWWQEVSIKESKSIEELIENGYGENVNISAQYKDIKITIEKVVADDTGTILSYSIEDITKKKRYMMDYEKGISFQGEFIYPHEGCTNPLKGDSILYSDVTYIQKGMFRLDPIKGENATINIIISELQYGDKKPFSIVKGTWELNVPIIKHKARNYTLNKEVDIDGNRVIFKEIKIAPTNTALTFAYNENQGTNYSISTFQGIKLISNGKEYKSKYMGYSSSKSDSHGNNEITLEFDSMYLDNPDKVKIYVGRYIANVNKYAHYHIDVNKEFPQIFEYFGSKISINSVNIGDEKTELTMSQSFEKNQYESLNIEFDVKGHPFARSYGGQIESYTLDKRGNKIELGKTDESIESIEPKTYITKQQIIIQDPLGIEKIPQEYYNGKLIPVKLFVKGYQETRYVNKSFTVKLIK